jgi:hypothetical protein
MLTVCECDINETISGWLVVVLASIVVYLAGALWVASQALEKAKKM